MCPIVSESDFLSRPEWGWLSCSLPGLDRGSDASAERLVPLLTNWLFNHSFILAAPFKCVAIRNYFFLPPFLPARLLAFLSVNDCLFFCLCPPLREMMIHAASCSTKDDLQYGEMSEVRAQTPPPFTFLSPPSASVTRDVSFLRRSGWKDHLWIFLRPRVHRAAAGVPLSGGPQGERQL